METESKKAIIQKFVESNKGRVMTSAEIREELLDMVTLTVDEVAEIMNPHHELTWDGESGRLVWIL